MNIPKRLAIYESPIRLLLLIAVTLFVTHTLAMVAFALLPQLSMWAESLVQSILLLTLLFPVLYFFSLRPLLLHIAERQRAEEIMRESEHKYRNLFEHLSDAAFLVDVESGRILDTNSQGERLLGRTRGEIMGMNQSKLYAAGNEKEQREWFATYARQERPQDFETEIFRKDGAGVPVRVGAVPTVLHERRLILQFMRDMTPQDVRQQENAANERERI